MSLFSLDSNHQQTRKAREEMEVQSKVDRGLAEELYQVRTRKYQAWCVEHTEIKH